MEPIIKIDHLSKDFGHGRGVFDVSFEVNEGECFGYLGPNGAGKSTTIRMLMGFTNPDQGGAYIKGREVRSDRANVMNGVSYIPGEIALPPTLTGYDVLKIQMELKGVKDKSLMNELIKTFELDPSLLCKSMSLGMKRKLVVASAFLSDPSVIILDEPTSGLDPEMQAVFVSLIKKKKEEGKTILLSSHIFGEVDSLADRIGIIKDGKIVSFFKADDLKHKTIKTYILTFKEEIDRKGFVLAPHKRLKIVDPSLKDNAVLIAIEEKDINGALRELSCERLLDFSEKKETLEDYFMSFYKEERTYERI